MTVEFVDSNTMTVITKNDTPCFDYLPVGEGVRIEPIVIGEFNFRNLIKKVIFNDPATIILWKDGTKTVVKVGPDEFYDPEKGMAMCISKKFLGNKSNFNNVFTKHMEAEGVYPEGEHTYKSPVLDVLSKLRIANAFKKQKEE